MAATGYDQPALQRLTFSRPVLKRAAWSIEAGEHCLRPILRPTVIGSGFGCRWIARRRHSGCLATVDLIAGRPASQALLVSCVSLLVGNFHSCQQDLHLTAYGESLANVLHRQQQQKLDDNKI